MSPQPVQTQLYSLVQSLDHFEFHQHRNIFYNGSTFSAARICQYRAYAVRPRTPFKLCLPVNHVSAARTGATVLTCSTLGPFRAKPTSYRLLQRIYL